MNVARLLRDYGDAGAVNSLLAPWGFVDDETFLTKAGHLGVVYGVRGVDGDSLPHPQRRTLTHRFEAALRGVIETEGDAVKRFDSIEEFHESARELIDAFQRGDFPGTIRLIDRHFGPSSYSLKSLFKDEQRRILEELATHSDVVSVPSHSARVALEDVYGISAAGVAVLPHGSAWTPVDPRPGIRRRLLTWGLLGPGKGIERAFAALAPLRLLSPAPHYQVVGQIHPNILRRQGPAYRESLVQLADDLNVSDMVEFDDSYQSEESLYRTVTEADVIVLPYDNDEQVCSGVLTEAITAGRPVVATNFPHARELLGSGAGILVDHDDIEGMTAAIRQLLTDDFAYRRAVEEARSVAQRLSWSTIARRHIEYFDRLGESVAVS